MQCKRPGKPGLFIIQNKLTFKLLWRLREQTFATEAQAQLSAWLNAEVSVP